MTEEQHAALQQLAKIVIDAYLDREKTFVPIFKEHTVAVMYLSPPEDTRVGAEGLRLGFWYERLDDDLEPLD